MTVHVKQSRAVILLLAITGTISGGINLYSKEMVNQAIQLPEPKRSGKLSLEEAIRRRRSRRSFKDSPLELGEVSQLLWAAGGETIDALTGPSRSFPSGGGIYPQDFYLQVNTVKGLKQGIYRYNWRSNCLVSLKEGSFGKALSRASLGQEMIARASINIIITARFSRTALKYGRRGEKYVLEDAGFSGQNIYLQAEALGLGTVAVGAFSEKAVAGVLGLEADETPILIMPVGRY